jgi:hypothetical protein
LRKICFSLLPGFLFALACCVVHPTAFAQTFYGSVVGTVTDASSAAIQGAAVTLTNSGTGERRSAGSDSGGSFRFVNLVPGNYKLEVEMAGFKRYTRDAIPVSVEAAVRVDVGMQVGDVSQSVAVEASAPLLQTENATLSQVVGARSVQELPLNGRNVLNLVALVPGVVPQGATEGASLTGKNVFAAGNYQIGGGAANQSASYFDGVPVTTGFGNIVGLVPSQDAVAEFRVETSSNSAEYGRYAGGVINLASKAGSNEFHGSAYEFLRNKSLNAGTFFANATGAGKPAFNQNQYGVSAGGPIQKDKTFFFFGWEGFRQRQGTLFLATVPTAQMLQGDFSNYRNAQGAVIPIYDPLTQCGQYGNPACGTGTDQRTPFPGNIIPANRIDPVSRKLADFPNWGKPNTPGQQYTQNFNFSRNANGGGDNDQFNIRGDRNVSAKQRILARFTRWNNTDTPVNVYGNGLYNENPWYSEIFTTHQAVFADTYLFSPTTIFDIRLSYMRWKYARVVGTQGIDLVGKFGFPSYFNQLPELRQRADATAFPRLTASGYTTYNNLLINGIDNNYVLTPSLTKIRGRHTLKFGADLRRSDIAYFQLDAGGTYTFDNLFTSRNALNPGATGNGIASFLLGYAASGNIISAGWPAGGMRYQAYFANDSIQATNKLTLNLGIRWEIPGVYTERFDREAAFNPTEPNPVLTGIRVNGQPVLGALDLVNSPIHPERGMKQEHFRLFSPRFGAAYRLNDRTVIRTGAGIYFLPANLQFTESPYGNPLNNYTNPMVVSIDSSVTPFSTMSNPFPNGLTPALGRNPNYQKLLLGLSPSAPFANTRYPYAIQWNFTIQRQLPKDLALEAGYAGSRGVHLPLGAYQIDQLPDPYLSLGSQLRQQVANPFYGQVAYGTLAQPTVQAGQLLLPFPEYVSATENGNTGGDSIYHSAQIKIEKRFHSGGTLLGSYTMSKLIGDVESLTTWLEKAGGFTAPFQDATNLRGERSLSSFDVRQRLTISYVLDIPMGKGRKIFPSANGFADKLLSGWGINGVSVFQKGIPVGMTATPNLTGFNTGLRPNVASGCNTVVGGAAQSRLNQWFNTSCFTVPAAYTFGSESRTDPVLRNDGVNNFNFALFKRTPIRERFNLEFRAEIFNLFNRVQFGPPNNVETTAANSTFGQVTTQLNDPRLIQTAVRLRF